MLLNLIVSGGQTGADRAALDVALELGIECGGWCPRGRRAEDGVLGSDYPLRQTASASYRQRTEMNVVQADGTLICNTGSLSGGTLQTLDFARIHGKPHLVLQLDTTDLIDAVEETEQWIRENNIKVLNVAGPRASNAPDIYTLTYALLREMLM